MKILRHFTTAKAGTGKDIPLTTPNNTVNYPSASHAGLGKVPESQKRSPTFWWSIAIGIGLALFPVHNQWLTNLTTTSSGNTIVFIPTIALLLVIMATGTFIVGKKYWPLILKNGWGDPKVAIPLAVIVVAIGLSGIPEPTLMGKLAPFFMGIVLFGLYLASRILGKELFIPVGIGVAIASLGVIVYQALHPGNVTGGYVFEYNYDIVAGYVLLGSALFIHRWRKWLVLLGAVAMVLSGSPEALFSLAVVGIVILVRRDLPSRKVLIIGGAVVVALVVVALSTGLFHYLGDAIKDNQSASYEGATVTREPISYRIEIIQQAMTHIKPLGNGYSLTEFYEGIVHNVPLIIVQELGWPGVVAGVAWLWICLYCLWKTKWKYAWILVLSLSVWDHFLWDQLALYWWVLIGVSLESKDNDYVFRKLPSGD